MAVETDTERAIFFGIDDFGTAATYTPSGGSGVTINGIFEKDFEAIDVGGSVAFAATSPTFHCRTSDVSTAAEGDTLAIGSDNYIIRVVMDDGTGLTMLQLEAQ
jgi:hypothetical protein